MPETENHGEISTSWYKYIFNIDKNKGDIQTCHLYFILNN